ncbi:hypothetical protein [Streptosporangium vulgare]|uniref:Uncharacterized protein n=1 Tax=Streptosporangium vulgare TaxID=46190 RepID=A0ABV5TQ41_9ACTN
MPHVFAGQRLVLWRLRSGGEKPSVCEDEAEHAGAEQCGDPRLVDDSDDGSDTETDEGKEYEQAVGVHVHLRFLH